MCVNPDHLFAGTPKENTMDMWRKGRGVNNLKPQKGAENGSAKLQAGDAEIIRLIRSNGESYKNIASYFNISKSHVGNIIHGRSWNE